MVPGLGHDFDSPGLLLHSGGQYRKPDAFKFKRNGQWIDVSTDEFYLRVEELFLRSARLD